MQRRLKLFCSTKTINLVYLHYKQIVFSSIFIGTIFFRKKRSNKPKSNQKPYMQAFVFLYWRLCDSVQWLENSTLRMVVVNYLDLYSVLNFGWLLIPLINIYSHTHFWGRQSQVLKQKMSNAPVLQGHARHANSHTLLSQQKTPTRVGNNLT